MQLNRYGTPYDLAHHLGSAISEATECLPGRWFPLSQSFCRIVIRLPQLVHRLTEPDDPPALRRVRRQLNAAIARLESMLDTTANCDLLPIDSIMRLRRMVRRLVDVTTDGEVPSPDGGGPRRGGGSAVAVSDPDPEPSPAAATVVPEGSGVGDEDPEKQSGLPERAWTRHGNRSRPSVAARMLRNVKARDLTCESDVRRLPDRRAAAHRTLGNGGLDAATDGLDDHGSNAGSGAHAGSG